MLIQSIGRTIPTPKNKHNNMIFLARNTKHHILHCSLFTLLLTVKGIKCPLQRREEEEKKEEEIEERDNSNNIQYV